MANSVTFPVELGGDGKTYTDDTNPSTGMANGGHRVRFIPALYNAVSMAATAKDHSAATSAFLDEVTQLRSEVGADRAVVEQERATTVSNRQASDASAQASSDSAAAALASKNAAKISEDNAKSSENAAGSSAAAALASKNAAKTSEDNAAQTLQDAYVIYNGVDAINAAVAAAEGEASAAAGSASEASDSAAASLQAKTDAQDLYGDLSAIEAAKQAAAQSAISADEQRALAVTAKQEAEQALAQAIQAAADANVDVDEAIAALVDSSPGALDTLNELAAALGDDPNFATTVNNAIAQKVPLAGADLGTANLKARLTHNSNYFYIGSFSSTTYGEGQLRIWWNENDKQLNMGGAELVSVSLNASLLDKGTVPIARIASTGNRFSSATDVLLQANAMNNHRTSADHDDRYPLKTSTGTAAALDVQTGLTDTTAGRLMPYGAFGLGEVGNYSPTGVNIDSADSPNGFWRADSSRQTSAHWPLTPFIGGMFQTRTGANSAVYQILMRNGVVWFRTSGSEPFTEMFHAGNTVALKAAASLDKVKNIALNWQYGDSTPTHFWASQGSSSETYVYGAEAMRAGLGLGGAALAGITSSRASTSTDHALTAAAMNSHRLSGDHDERYYQKSEFSEQSDANTPAVRTAQGDLRARLFRTTYTSTNSNIGCIYTSFNTDGNDFMRPSTPAQVRAALDLDDLGAITGSNSNGRYYLYPDGRLVMHCGAQTFTQDPSSARYLLANVTLPYTPLGSAEHYVTAAPSSDAGDYVNETPLWVGTPLVKPGRLSSGTVVQVRLAHANGNNYGQDSSTTLPVRIESRWK